ncbi:unnamed protein product, partial [Brassica napus]
RPSVRGWNQCLVLKTQPPLFWLVYNGELLIGKSFKPSPTASRPQSPDYYPPVPQMPDGSSISWITTNDV